MDLAQPRRLLDCETLQRALEPHRGRIEHSDWRDRAEGTSNNWAYLVATSLNGLIRYERAA
jgi:hypothetical protein